ncbi:MAG: MFS transporter [Actinomycetota bacterium]|nr:MFS transporter [Actinomycetota bacterium]
MSARQPDRLPATFWRLWWAGGISNLGDGMFAVALPLLAARITDDRLSIGLIGTFFTIPWLLFAVPVGVLIDRVDRRKVLVLADVCRGGLVGGLALVAAFSEVQLWMLWVLAFGLGVGEVLFDNTSQAILPAVVPGEQLERANGFFYATEVATNTFLGLPLGSVLFGFAVWLPFGIDAASFVAAALLAATLRGSFRPAAGGPPTGSMVDDMREGFRWLRGHSLLRRLTVAVALMNLGFAATQATFVLFALQELDIRERYIGPLVAIVGVGSLLAGMAGGRLVDRSGRRAALLVAGLVPVFTCAAMGLLPVTWWVIAMSTVQALTTTIWSIVTVSLRQQIVPDALFGRVNSVYRWVSTGSMPLGALVGGLVAKFYGLRAPYFAAAAVLLLGYLVVAGPISREVTDVPRPAAGTTTGTTTGATTGAAAGDADDTPRFTERDPLDDLL